MATAALPEDQIEAIRVWIDGLPKRAAVDFNRDVEPIFQASCYGCHSGARPKSELRLDAGATAFKGGIGGKVIVPGDSGASRLVHRVEGKGSEARMPLGKPALSEAQIATLRRWIDSGAKWPAEKMGSLDKLVEKHWAYQKPIRPDVPAVKGAVRNAIDNFVLARLEKQNLSFSPEASKEKLIRRVSLDLTGLPPTPAEVEAFVKDKRADAYEQLVDRLLASPHYGERWARPWLDYARYSDTNGYEADFRRTMWKYRDWVITALNQDMPYDRFTIEQVAGDMLPNATTAQKIATGFHRNTMYNEEGGVDRDESYFEVLVDRVNTTASVWLGSTIGCSQCHNHKYDPFLQKEYYQLMAFFSNAEKKAIRNGSESWKYEEPLLELPTPEEARERARVKDRISELEKKVDTATPALAEEQREWERNVLRASSDWSLLKLQKAESSGGTTFQNQPDGSLLAQGENPRVETYTLSLQTDLPRLTGLRIEALPHAGLPRGGPGRDVYGNFILTNVKLEVQMDGQWRTVQFGEKVGDDGRVADPKLKHLWTIDASKEDKRLPRQLVLVPASPVDLKGSKAVRVTLRHESDLIGQSIGHFRLSATAAEDPLWVVKVRARVRPVLEAKASERSADDARKLADSYRTVAPSLEHDRDELEALKKQLKKMSITTALIMGETPGTARPVDYVRTRGGFSAKADKVFANVPASLGSLDPKDPPNRLGLARWLASKENPLTARVEVNRIWEQYFGRGIVETSEDFGTQGQRPSHPELLDWLAVEFMDKDWSMKAIHRLIVTSNTYRQTSDVSPELLKLDPQNRLISRGPRLRLEAEMIRDVTLAASGLLADKVGGPSVFPPQPPGVWDLPYNDDKWEESTGPDRYRRGLYTFVRRSAPYPAMVNFDATSREFCTVRRTRTNTPLQALTTLNDRAFFETAQALGRRLQKEGGGNEKKRIDYGYRLCTGRAATKDEINRILDWRKTELAYFRDHKDEAAKLAGDAKDVPEQAFWTMLGNVLLNMDETLTKE